VAVSVAAVIKCIGVSWVEPDCFGLIGNGAIVIAVAGVNVAAMHISSPISRVGPNRLAVIRDGFLEPAAPRRGVYPSAFGGKGDIETQYLGCVGLNGWHGLT
jgi:hypothetical protein